MQLGMIGLGRMGANMVRRLITHREAGKTQLSCTKLRLLPLMRPESLGSERAQDED